MKCKYTKLIKELESLGMRFYHRSLVSTGRYTAEDGIWNYKDAIAHIPYLHALVENVPFLNHKDSLNSLFFQKLFGFRFPIIVVDYEAEEYTQTAVTSMLVFVLIVHNVVEEIEPMKTRVTTNYYIGAPGYLKWLSPFIFLTLKRNYKVLMSTDLPLRDRRGQLRDWGYQFEKSDYIRASNIHLNNWKPPVNDSGMSVTIDLSQSLKNQKELLTGRDDHLGLRLRKEGAQLSVFPRMCPHEGAPMDKAPCKRNSLQCPWHGRKVPSLAKFELDGRAQKAESLYHSMCLKGNQLRIEFKSAKQDKKAEFTEADQEKRVRPLPQGSEYTTIQ